MASFVMMQPPAAANGEADLPVAIRDGFYWPAFLVPPIWFAWNRLWVESGVALAALVALNAIGIQFEMGGVASLLSLLVALWAGLEGAAMRIAGLTRRGYVEVGAIWAGSRDEAELRFATSLVAEAPEAPPAPMPRPRAIRPHAPLPAIGLVGMQEKR